MPARLRVPAGTAGYTSMSTGPDSPINAGQRVTLPAGSALLRTKIDMAFNRLMAVYLGRLEELADEHDEAMGKLMDALPPEHKASVHLADIYGEARFAAIRKHVLTVGNEQRREALETVDFLRLDNQS